ncbi:MAG TPA: thiamine pyrophosphate-binding protein [Candidatus Polarisedimenticolia bacterium]|nr:thiamine pyrophosphate-binding protein [Candidatus Polarisedimenticolia bacterium]
MNGTQAFLQLLHRAGVRHLFGNPGHTELPMLDVLAGMPDMTYVLGLNEAVSMAMADGYAMASGKLGVFCSHITPGFGNSIGMLYDASKTAAPLLVIAGQQDGRFSFTEPALWGEMVRLAKPLTKWAYQVERIDDLTRAMRRAIKIATTPPTGPVFLSLPSDVLRGEGEFDLTLPTAVGPRFRGDKEQITRACDLLCKAERPLLIAGDEVGKSGAEEELQALAEILGAAVYSEPSSNTFNFPSDHPLYLGTLARVQMGVREVLEHADLIFSVGADVFTMATYADLDPLPPGKRLLQLSADAWQLGKNYPPEVAILGDAKATLAEMVQEIRARTGPGGTAGSRVRLAMLTKRKAEEHATACRTAESGATRQPLAPTYVMKQIVDLAPSDAIIVDESNTSGFYLRHLLLDKKLRYFGLKGGGLGWGLPASVGVAFARPEHRVLALLGDGGAMYTIPALWTAAHHRSKVTFVICNNTQYRIVKHRLHNYGGEAARHSKYLGVELRDPEIDFAGLGRSLGIDSHRVDHPDQLGEALASSLAADGPTLLDVSVEGSYPERETKT